MKLLETIKNKEVKNASWIIFGKILQMIISFVLSLFTARYLGPNNYGLINYGMAYVAFFSSICTLGINSVIVKEFVDNPREEGLALGTTFVLRGISSVLSSIIIICIVAIVDKYEPTTIVVVSLCSLSLPFQIFDTYNSWFQSKYQSKITSIATLFAHVLIAVYKIVLLVLGKSVEWFALASSLDFICIAIFLFIAYRKKQGPRLQFSKKKAVEILSKSYHYILAGMMVAIYAQTDKLMLKYMLDESAVGFYSLATTICGMWVFVLSAIIDSMYPTILQLNNKDEKAFNRKNKQLYAIVFYVSIVVSILFVFCGDFAIRILYGEEFLLAANPLKIITWYTAFSYLGVARNVWIVSKNKQKYLVPIYFSSAIINVILNIVFIPLWGESGAAVASLVTQIFTSVILPFFIKDLRPNAKLMLEAIVLKDVFNKY